MKKNYRKPTAQLVDFSLSSSIAAGCTYNDDDLANSGLQSPGSCAFYDPSYINCYQVPAAGSSLHNS